MTNSSIDLSSRIDDPTLVELLTAISVVATNMRIPFFAIGAMARDLILWSGFGIRPGRETTDVDLAFSVSTWEEYDRLRLALQDTGEFRPIGDKQRMVFKEVRVVDVLPFGEIVDRAKKITWRPDGDTELNLLGFDEAYSHALRVKVRSEPLVEIKIASATGLVLMKIFAWNDRRPGTRDAIDLGILIRSYLQIGNEKRLWEEHSDLLESDNFDYDVAGAHVLGRDLVAICEPETKSSLLAILDRELNSNGDLPLVVNSAGSSPQIDRTLKFWQAIRQELADSVANR